MAGGAQLLRMLEPAVRPAGAPALPNAPKPALDQQSFDEILADAQHAAPVKVSGHASQRLEQMGMTLGPEQLEAVAEATDRAAARGANESLMLLDRLGLIVNIPNRTVVTALSEQRMNEGVVTNIDSTVWVNPDR